VVRKFKRGFGATVREVIARTVPRSVTTADTRYETVADLCEKSSAGQRGPAP